MRALTLIQPWAYAICYLGKRIENRDWRPPSWIIGKRIAIHAGKKIDREVLFDLGIAKHTEIVTGAIVATAKIVCVHDSHDPPSADQSRWWFGPFGWRLDEVRVLDEPIPCRGALGLWEVPVFYADTLSQREVTGG